MKRIPRKLLIFILAVTLFAAFSVVYYGVVSQNSAYDPADNADWGAVLFLSFALIACLRAIGSVASSAVKTAASLRTAWAVSLRGYYGCQAGVENIIIRC